MTPENKHKVESVITWRPVSERPPIGQRLLLLAGAYIYMGRMINKGLFADLDNFVVHSVTLWAALPCVPEIMERLAHPKSPRFLRRQRGYCTVPCQAGLRENHRQGEGFLGRLLQACRRSFLPG